jgi:hypothetical protein
LLLTAFVPRPRGAPLKNPTSTDLRLSVAAVVAVVVGLAAETETELGSACSQEIEAIVVVVAEIVETDDRAVGVVVAGADEVGTATQDKPERSPSDQNESGPHRHSEGGRGDPTGPG